MFTGKKFLMTLVIIFTLCSCAYSEVKESHEVRIGIMKHNMTEQEFRRVIATIFKWTVFDPAHQNGTVLKFYEELLAMLMALSTGNIDEIEVPKATGEYIISRNPDYKISCVLRSLPASFVFGFLKDKGEGLRDRFNAALREMKADGTLDALKTKYFSDPSQIDLEPILRRYFPGAETIKIAVTGDVPPIDYITEDDQPAGFNTAILAEIARRLEVNIELFNISAAGRTAALTSGRVDVVFWFTTINNDDNDNNKVKSVKTVKSVKFLDIPDSVIISDSYYDWDTFVHVKRK